MEPVENKKSKLAKFALVSIAIITSLSALVSLAVGAVVMKLAMSFSSWELAALSPFLLCAGFSAGYVANRAIDKLND